MISGTDLNVIKVPILNIMDHIQEFLVPILVKCQYCWVMHSFGDPNIHIFVQRLGYLECHDQSNIAHQILHEHVNQSAHQNNTNSLYTTKSEIRSLI